MSRSPHPTLRPRARLLIVAGLLGPLLLALGALRPRADDGPVTATVTAAATAAPPVDRDLPRPLLGFAINAHHIGDLSRYLESVDAIAGLGANTLIVVTPSFQKHVDSSSIRRIPSRCPTDEQLVAILRRARQRGLATVLMPIVLVEDPGEKDWRGLIRPRNWDGWWKSYGRFLDRYVDIAVAAEVDLLSVGSELNSTEDQVERWEQVIARTRARFPGRLTYSANWDRYEVVTFWPRLDVMSVSAYFELERDRPGAPAADLVRAWRPVQERLLASARRWDRPLLLSEVGYPSLPWANAHPWNYVAEEDTPDDHEAQARCWRAFFTAWRDLLTDPASGVLGFCGYRWDPYHHGEAGDTGYGIVGKPARDVIRAELRELGEKSKSQKVEKSK